MFGSGDDAVLYGYTQSGEKDKRAGQTDPQARIRTETKRKSIGRSSRPAGVEKKARQIWGEPEDD